MIKIINSNNSINLQDKQEEQYNINLIVKYLVKYYIEEANISETKAQELAIELLTSKTKNKIYGYTGLTYFLGQYSLEFFNLFYLRDIFCNKDCADIAPIHFSIWDDIENIILNQTVDQQGYILPRGTGKSTFGTLSASIWTACYAYKKMIVICSSTNRLAKKFLTQIKETIQGNKYIEQSFGQLIDTKSRNFKVNEEVIQLTNNVCIEAYGSESSLRGVKNEKLNCRPDLIILDDYQDSKIDVKTEQGRENKWERYSSDLKYAKQRTLYNVKGKVIKQGTVILAFGTVQHKEDFYMRLYNSLTWNFRKEKGILVDNVDELFESDLWQQFKNILKDTNIFSFEERLKKARDFFMSNKNEMNYPVLWESFWDKVELAKDYFENSIKFKQEIQSDLDSIGEKRFKTIVTKSREYIEDRTFSKCMLGIDPAGIKTKSRGKKKDFFAFCVLGKNNEIKYVREGELIKFNNNDQGYEEYIQHTLKLLRKYSEITHVYVEKNTFNGFDVQKMKEYINKDDDLKHRNIIFINEAQHKNKDDKITTIVSDVNMGTIIFNEENEEFINQIKDFSGCDFSAHDDAPDILSEVVNRIDDIEVIEKVQLFDRKLLGL